MKTKEELLKIYSAYLPYQLECLIQGHNNQDGKAIKETMLGIYDGTEIFTSLGLKDYQTNEIEDVFPILYSMDMLTKEIEHKGERFIPIDNLKFKSTQESYIGLSEYNDQLYKYTKYEDVQLLLEWHFNIFGLDESEYIQKQPVIQK